MMERGTKHTPKFRRQMVDLVPGAKSAQQLQARLLQNPVQEMACHATAAGNTVP